jgi:hypothetical protein
MFVTYEYKRVYGDEMKRFFSLLIASLLATSTLAHAKFDIVQAMTRHPNENDRVYARRVQRELGLRKSELSLKLFWLTTKLDAKPCLNKEQTPEVSRIKLLLENEMKPLDTLTTVFEKAVLTKEPEAIALTKQAKDQYVQALKARKQAIPSFNIETAKTKEEVLHQFDYRFMEEGLTKENFFTKYFPGFQVKHLGLEDLKALYRKAEAEKVQSLVKKPVKEVSYQ